MWYQVGRSMRHRGPDCGHRSCEEFSRWDKRFDRIGPLTVNVKDRIRAEIIIFMRRSGREHRETEI